MYFDFDYVNNLNILIALPNNKSMLYESNSLAKQHGLSTMYKIHPFSWKKKIMKNY